MAQHTEVITAWLIAGRTPKVENVGTHLDLFASAGDDCTRMVRVQCGRQAFTMSELEMNQIIATYNANANPGTPLAGYQAPMRFEDAEPIDCGLREFMPKDGND